MYTWSSFSWKKIPELGNLVPVQKVKLEVLYKRKVTPAWTWWLGRIEPSLFTHALWTWASVFLWFWTGKLKCTVNCSLPVSICSIRGDKLQWCEPENSSDNITAHYYTGKTKQTWISINHRQIILSDTNVSTKYQKLSLKVEYIVVFNDTFQYIDKDDTGLDTF